MHSACSTNRRDRRVLRISSWTAFFALLIALVPLHAARANLGPLETAVDDRFDADSPTHDWAPALGVWTQTSGTYNSNSAVPTAITHLTGPFIDPNGHLEFDRYAYRARMLNQRALADTSVGVVYEYQDSANYYELIFSPSGQAQLRRVQNNVPTVLATASYEEGGQNLWFDVEIYRELQSLTFSVNGQLLFGNVHQPGQGTLGLVSHGTTARFDNVELKFLHFIPGNLSPQNFTALPPGWSTGWWGSSSGWTVQNGYLSSPVAMETLANSTATAEFYPSNHGIRARMYNPYGAAGNQVGFWWARRYNEPGYSELVFNPVGTASINCVFGTAKQTIATASIPSLRHRWFQVTLNKDQGYSVLLDGVPIFDHVQNDCLEQQAPDYGIGLVAHWSPGRFDDFELRREGFPMPYKQTFDSATSDAEIRTGNWSIANGVLNSTGIGVNDLVTFPAGETHPDGVAVDYVYRARLMNQYGASGNRVGLVTNYISDGEYYKTVFSGAGEVYVSKVIQGTEVLQASATHNVPRNTWFDVAIVRVNNRTAVEVNSDVIISDVPQGQIRGGRIGVVTRFARGRFDNLDWQELP